ncbi:MAG: hypothetical protein ABIU54_05465 [Candidatus Eisenbacteria bacterium]
MHTPSVLHSRAWSAGVVLLVLALAGCGLRRDTVVGPSSSGPAINGVVLRSGVAIGDEWVKLYDNATGVLLDSALTNSAGQYSIPAGSAGLRLVKVSSSLPGDFGYVRYLFTGTGDSMEMPPLDLAAQGFDLATPADSAMVAQPNPIAPIHFTWTPYQGTYKWSGARVADSLGVQVWSSAQGRETAADWNGVGNSDPPYTGQLAPPGRYQWRVKIHLPNGVQAATRQRLISIGEI